MPLDKIKVSHIAKDCDITRSSFYYHFKDIYDLLEWTFDTEAVILLDKSTDVQTWEEGILLFMDYLQKNEKLFRSAYNSMGRVLMEKFIFKKAKHQPDRGHEDRPQGLLLQAQDDQADREEDKHHPGGADTAWHLVGGLGVQLGVLRPYRLDRSHHPSEIGRAHV